MSKLLFALLFLFVLAGCSKKVHPAQTPGVTVISGTSGEAVTTNTEKPPVVEKKLAPAPKKEKPTFPNSISVNDQAAKKSTDGRLYYDVMGHRYWKNYRDGKYYLYNKSMYKNPDFKVPGSN